MASRTSFASVISLPVGIDAAAGHAGDDANRQVWHRHQEQHDDGSSHVPADFIQSIDVM